MKTVMTTLILAVMMAASLGWAADAPPHHKYETKIPASVTTPDSVKTRLGTLKFFDGMPDQKTVDLVYDNLDFQRGVDAFLTGIPIASLAAFREGMRSVGARDINQVLIADPLLGSKGLYLTGNTTVTYLFGWIDLKDGPVVIEVPPNVLAFIDSFTFKYVTDIGKVGPDKGEGGKYLLLPPGYTGDIPEGYFVSESPTYGNWLGLRARPTKEDLHAGAKSLYEGLKIYGLADAKNPEPVEFINVAEMELNTVHANDFDFYKEIDIVVQEEPASAFNAETLGLFNSIGIVKGKPFAPDERMTQILTDAAAVANATSRALLFASRDPNAFYFPDRQWKTTFNGGYKFEHETGGRNLDGRTVFHYYATGITPAMDAIVVGTGSQYAYAERDSDGNYLDGGKTYKVTLPPNVPVKDFWAFTLYSGQTRSMLQTDQKFPGLDNRKEDLKQNKDGSYTVYFAPEAPEGHESNWIQTAAGKSWNTLFRLYGPLDPWFDRTWKPGDFELVK